MVDGCCWSCGDVVRPAPSPEAGEPDAPHWSQTLEAGGPTPEPTEAREPTTCPQCWSNSAVTVVSCDSCSKVTVVNQGTFAPTTEPSTVVTSAEELDAHLDGLELEQWMVGYLKDDVRWIAQSRGVDADAAKIETIATAITATMQKEVEKREEEAKDWAMIDKARIHFIETAEVALAASKAEVELLKASYKVLADTDSRVVDEVLELRDKLKASQQRESMARVGLEKIQKRCGEQHIHKWRRCLNRIHKDATDTLRDMEGET